MTWAKKITRAESHPRPNKHCGGGQRRGSPGSNSLRSPGQSGELCDEGALEGVEEQDGGPGEAPVARAAHPVDVRRGSGGK